MINDGKVLKNERIDDLECNGFCIIQDPSFFCFGMDAVLLSNYVTVKKNAKVVDMCSGNGIIPLLLCAKKKGGHITGIEIQEHMADMARRSVILNKVEESIDIINADIKNIKDYFKRESIDTVTCNPPYIEESYGLKNPNQPVNIARHEILLNLEDVISAAAYLLKPNGNFAMVHKPFRLPQIMTLMSKYRLEPKRLRMVQSDHESEPSMVLIEATHYGKPFMKIDPALNVYDKERNYTKELLSIYGKI